MGSMDKQLEDYLALCERIAKRMQREGQWPFSEPLETPNQNKHEQQKPLRGLHESVDSEAGRGRVPRSSEGSDTELRGSQ